MTADSLSQPALTRSEISLIFVGIMVAMLLAALDQTIVVTAMPTIGRDLGSIDKLPWVVTAYLLTATAVTPLYGKLSDIIGRRITLMVAIAVFMAASVASALAPSMLFLILARAAQGLGGGGLISLAQTIIADIVSPRERPRYQGYIASVFVTASIAGPVLGGLFAEHLHWSLIFWINVPLGLLALALTSGLLKKLPRHERPHKLDVAGAALMAGASALLLLALDWGASRFGWGSVETLGLCAASVLLWLGFAWRLATAPEPLIPPAVLANPVISRGIASALLAMGTLVGLTAYLPIYLETAFGLTAGRSGLALIPFMVGTVTGATISGRVMARVANYKRLPLAGLGLATAACVLLSVLPRGLSFGLIETVLPLISLGLGANLPVTTVAIQNAVEPHQLGTATGAMNFFRSLGGALLVAVFGAILFTGLPELAAANGPAGSADAFNIEPARVIAAFRPIFALAGLSLLLSLACLAAMPQRPLRSKVGPSQAVAE